MKRIEYFNWVRDIPFRIPLSLEEQDYCCEGKHKILMQLFKSIGLQTRPRVCETKWSYVYQIPKKIMEIPHDDDLMHLYLEVKIKERWRSIDASLDKRLKKVFRINEWDGKGSTSICVNPSKIYYPEPSLDLFQEEISKEDYLEELQTNGKFYGEFNNWLEDIRKENY